jgi:hypothetical protein
LNFIERNFVTAVCVGGHVGFLFFLKRQHPKSLMKFEQTQDIPAIAGDGLAFWILV